mmetsp:Transcript_95180/g.272837  ORF Transcript_95180/g.272837 Transcript_95180/m.272837 type:complete len:271 (-) Transcript_95180:80-892(-)|eukprot:CAMPEP_0177218806 /NCGR_PEP_ID=MMETSP0367-20130122/36016_1 /TAXON_ID=447022 ORGANISM="Scrippsiella hangoei-like, Strain SHHI-4" /NCGR_SAMPLE_ID=MMETSP0367 /ASSEMBLY_ACC=CAM_ASM_000362 /LENGTH=270 /DNA_ID=CAMNT_0018668471 /DNA_START=57 /DNA_END=869 /DNA_ORIENTATION=+
MASKPVVEDEEEALHALVNGDVDLEFKDDNSGKVRVKSTGHEMPPRLHLVKEYIKGPKYQKAREMYSFDFSQYKPNIVPHEHQAKFLYCNLTRTTLPMDPKKVLAHVKGKRYIDMVKAREEGEVVREAKEQKKKDLRTKLWAQAKAKAKAKAEAGGAAKEGAPKEGAAATKKTKPSKRKRAASAGAASGGDAVANAASETKGKKKPERAVQKLRKNQLGKMAKKAADSAKVDASEKAPGSDGVAAGKPEKAPGSDGAAAGAPKKKKLRKA